jgi:CHASE2 domain-containing sensor protein
MLNLEALFKDKIILIGSFTEDDIHSTIAGDMPGVMINYNAYYALSQGRHYLNIIAFFILFLVFFITTVSVLNDKHLSDYIPQRLIPESTVIQMLISWVSLSTLFTVVFFILYMVFKEVYDIFFISTYFTLLRTIKQILSAKQL